MNRALKNFFFLLLAGLITAMSISAKNGPMVKLKCSDNADFTPGLDKKLVQTLFAPKGLWPITWKYSCITANKTQAIVSVNGKDKAESWQLWLLEYSGKNWEVKRNFFKNCTGKYSLVDIDGDGQSELWVISGCIEKGLVKEKGLLLSIKDNSYKVLFSSEFIGNKLENQSSTELTWHKIKFEDIDGDGVKEIIDERVNEEYKKTSGNRLRIVKIKENRKEIVYKYNGRNFIAWK
ncbi:MAG: hypothetical protein H7A25_01510 [Leptospiraceae bacterium]|nr:hypothetical protein [Leptospiraceae bacterium]